MTMTWEGTCAAVVALAKKAESKRTSMFAVLAAVGVFLCALAPSSAIAEEEPRSMDFTYNFTVTDVDMDAETVYGWIPIPPSNDKQIVHGFMVNTNHSYDIVSEDEYGNSFLMFDLKEGGPDVSVTFRVTRSGFTRGMYNWEGSDNPRWLMPDSMVPLDGVIAEEAMESAGGVEGSTNIGRSIYDHILDSMTYGKDTDGWGRGDAIYAHNVRRGNCTDFHSLFIGQARTLGVPARFWMGFNIPSDGESGPVPGYHCWAEFVGDDGWMPVDCSEVAKKPERREELFGDLDNHRIEFVLGRDIPLPGSAAGVVNFIIYPYVEVDGEAHSSLEKSFSYVNL